MLLFSKLVAEAMMKAQDIRDKFVKYFESKGHKHLPSSSLVPHNDKTLLFANAGMNQFKNYFTGIEKTPLKRAVTIQKCVRAGGKHNDLENVGLTARHHTFFEMLGNFSFGDYFKADAISYAWEFLTQILGIPEDKLFVTVHHSDDEAFQIWKDKIGIPANRIFRKGDKDNFWAMGDTGPCGPCSEIFFDHGPEHSTEGLKLKEGQDILDDEQRYVEIWNLVFMQYEQREDGRVSLPNPSIDTGAGLERIACALQGCYWNYDSDLFSDLIHNLEQLSGKKYSNTKFTSSIRIVVDHIRACSMLISDGVVPSNEGRGYVLRRIIRRATRHLKILEAPGGTLAELARTVFDNIKNQYPENFKNSDLAYKMLEAEELKFLETLDNGLRYLKQAISKDVIDSTFSGAAAFKLYDTFGFPLDLTESILAEQSISVDKEAFHQLMEERKEESRKSWKGKLNLDTKLFYDLKERFGETKFTGYTESSTTSKLLANIQLNESTRGLLFKETPFYGESGGQAGDSGTINYDNSEIPILDTIKPIEGITLHVIESSIILPERKQFTLNVKSSERTHTARNHTATHLLHKVLADVLGSHVKQAGSSVSPEKLRFDFTHMKALTKDELSEVEQRVNRMIDDSLEVSAEVKSYKKALDDGAMALFGEKYGDRVRVVSIAGKSIELCGGTHVSNTSHIKFFKIVTESSLSVGIRRIEALTSTAAINYLQERSQLLAAIEGSLKTPPSKLLIRIEKLNSELRHKNKEIERLNDKINVNSSQNLFDATEELPNGFTFTSAKSPSSKEMRNLSDLFLDKQKKGFLFLYSSDKEKASIIFRGPKASNSINLKNIFTTISQKHCIRGGGRPDMIQGTTESSQVNSICAQFKSELIAALEAVK